MVWAESGNRLEASCLEQGGQVIEIETMGVLDWWMHAMGVHGCQVIEFDAWQVKCSQSVRGSFGSLCVGSKACHVWEVAVRQH